MKLVEFGHCSNPSSDGSTPSAIGASPKPKQSFKTLGSHLSGQHSKKIGGKNAVAELGTN
jgi:hypothetical protein